MIIVLQNKKATREGLRIKEGQDLPTSLARCGIDYDEPALRPLLAKKMDSDHYYRRIDPLYVNF